MMITPSSRILEWGEGTIVLQLTGDNIRRAMGNTNWILNVSKTWYWTTLFKRAFERWCRLTLTQRRSEDPACQLRPPKGATGMGREKIILYPYKYVGNLGMHLANCTVPELFGIETDTINIIAATFKSSWSIGKIFVVTAPQSIAFAGTNRRLPPSRINPTKRILLLM